MEEEDREEGDGRKAPRLPRDGDKGDEAQVGGMVGGMSGGSAHDAGGAAPGSRGPHAAPAQAAPHAVLPGLAATSAVKTAVKGRKLRLALRRAPPSS